MPGLRPVSTTVVLLSTIWTFNMFPVIFLLTRGGPGDATEILVTYAYRFSFVDSPRDFAESAAWGVLILRPPHGLRAGLPPRAPQAGRDVVT